MRVFFNLREARPGALPCGRQQYLRSIRQRQHIRSDTVPASPGGRIVTQPLDHAACLNKYRDFGGSAESLASFVATRRAMPPGGLSTMI